KLLRDIGEKYGKTPTQVALNWLIVSSPVVVPIPGAKAPEQVDDLAGAVGWRLKAEDWRLLDEASRAVSISYSVGYIERELKL
ncbi:MAG: aldo/keto reductase, partial [Thermofilaceae archaeon]